MRDRKELFLVVDDLEDALSAERLGTLDGKASSAGDNKAGKYTKSTRNTEKYSVVILLDEAVVLKEHTRVGIDIGPGVGGLAVVGENTGNDIVKLSNKVEKRIAAKMLECEVTLASVSGIGLAKHSVTITRDDLA
mmetsp:Transcript_6854/g.17245  ORF Transcript_6854/g.17245 Transcript_6854/m.17245 type:complete len:135 (+) Transcript_6854:2319-2723(+)